MNVGDHDAHLYTRVSVFGENVPTHIRSSRWRSKTDWRIAMTMSSLSAAMIRAYSTSGINSASFGPATPEFARLNCCRLLQALINTRVSLTAFAEGWRC